MFFNPNQSEFSGENQHVIWQFGTHIVPLNISLADVDDLETKEGCIQIYDCTMEILSDMYNNPDWYKEKPRWYTGDYLAWLVNQNNPMKKHSDEFFRYLQKILEFGFYYNEDSQKWSNDRYPLFFDYFQRLVALAKERKQNLGGYLDRRDFRLFAKKIVLSFDDLLRPLSDANKEQALEIHRYAVEKGMKVEMKDPYCFRYVYKKLYSLEIHNNPFDVLVPYRLDNGKYIPNQFGIFLQVADNEPDSDELIRYIKGSILVCNCCNGTKKANERCSNWVTIRGERRLSSTCHPAIGKYRRGTHSFDYNDYDIKMLKRMIDVRIKQVDKFRDEQKG